MSTGTLVAGAPTSASRADREGLVLCVVSATGFGAMAVLAKLAYDAGVGIVELLSVRFALATILLTLVGAAMRRRSPLRAPRRAVLGALALGAVAYTAESGLFFASLQRMGASVAELLLYAYPSLVVLGAILLGREQASRRRGGALALASGGVVLVLVGGEAGALDPVGVLLALGAAAGYTAYILLADTIGRRLDALGLATLVCAGATVSFTAVGLATGSLDFAFGPEGWAAIGAIAVFSTVVPLSAFLAGMERIGPGRASILSALEPPITLLLAFAVFSEQLSPVQLLGGGLVVGAVMVLQLRAVTRRRLRGLRRRGGSPQVRLGSARVRAPVPARAAAARPLGQARAYRERLGV